MSDNVSNKFCLNLANTFLKHVKQIYLKYLNFFVLLA